MCAIDLKTFEKKIHLRQIRQEDFDAIIQLQRLCFPGMRTWSKEQLQSQIDIFPEGQVCLEYDGNVIASSGCLIVDFELYEEGHTWKEISGGGFLTTHAPDGDTLYGIEMMVHPDYRGMKLSRRLYDERKRLAREKNLMRIIIGGRIPGYNQYKERMTAREYVENVINKSLFDPVMTTQLANGFVLKRLIRSYLDSDEESKGFATFLEWTNIDYSPDPHRKYLTSRSVRICAVQYMMRNIDSFDDFARQCEYFVDVASGYKSDFILFPEIFTTQLLSCIRLTRPGADIRKVAEFTPQYLDLFTNLAVRYNINIIGGSHFTEEYGKIYNVAYLFKRNGEIGKQYKLHITPSERLWWGIEPGEKIELFDTDRGKISIQICYDIEFPEISRIAAEQGAHIIFVPFCTDERHAYLRVRYCAQARSIENEVYVVIAGNVGNLPDVPNMDIQYAQSGIFTPSDFQFSRDAIAAECTPNIETVIIHDVDIELLKRHRRSGSVQNLRDRRIDLFEVKLKK